MVLSGTSDGRPGQGSPPPPSPGRPPGEQPPSPRTEETMSTTPSDAVVSFREVGKVYDDDGLRVTAIKRVSLEIPRRRFAMIVGPSGSGKTTLLNLIGCIDRPTSGRLEVCGQDVGALADDALADFRSHHVAFVFQSFNLLPVLTAYENVEYPLLLVGVPAAERRRRTLAMLESSACCTGCCCSSGSRPRPTWPRRRPTRAGTSPSR